MMNQEKRDGFFKTLFIFIGVAVSLAAVFALAYALFRKYFEVTFECDGDGGIAADDDPFAEDEDGAFEPICCCEEEDEAPADADDHETANAEVGTIEENAI